MFELPKEKTIIEQVNPRRLFIFSHTKVGKTTLASMLPNNLIIDLEDGTNYISGLAVNIKEIAGRTGTDELTVLGQVAKKLKEENKEAGKCVYDYITIDTATSLEDIASSYATKLYKASAQGKNFEGKDVVRELAKGSGYLWLRVAFEKIYSQFDGLYGKALILNGHVKLTSLEKNGKELEAKDILLTGKLKGIVCQDADAIGYLYRNKDNPNETWISFKTNEEDLATGARPKHLRQQEFCILKYNPETDTFTDHWNKIFIEK